MGRVKIYFLFQCTQTQQLDQPVHGYYNTLIGIKQSFTVLYCLSKCILITELIIVSF